MKVSAPADRRFRRAQVRPGKKRAFAPPWRTIAVLTAAVAVSAGVLYLAVDSALGAEAMQINRITVNGTRRMSPGEVLTVLDGLRGKSMLTTDLESWRQRLLGSPWVGDAAMRRVFPGTVSVAISEREPLGIGRIGDALYLIDRRGAIIDEFGPGYADFDLPIIDGLAAAPAAGTLVDDARAALAGRLLAELQQHPPLARRVSQIDVTDARNAIVILKDDGALIHVGDERFAARVQAYLDLAARLREDVPDIDYVDMRFDERVYVRPLASGGDLRRTGGSE